MTDVCPQVLSAQRPDVEHTATNPQNTTTTTRHQWHASIAKKVGDSYGATHLFGLCTVPEVLLSADVVPKQHHWGCLNGLLLLMVGGSFRIKKVVSGLLQRAYLRTSRRFCGQGHTRRFLWQGGLCAVSIAFACLLAPSRISSIKNSWCGNS